MLVDILGLRLDKSDSNLVVVEGSWDVEFVVSFCCFMVWNFLYIFDRLVKNIG